MTRPQPDPIAALREIAPDGMPWFVVTLDLAYPFFQDSRGSGRAWNGCLMTSNEGLPFDITELAGTAINLRTGTVYLQSEDGTVIEVTRKEWDV